MATAPVLRPLGVGEILDAALKIAWRELGTLIRIVVVVVLPAQLLIALINVLSVPDYKPGVGVFPATGSTLTSDQASTVVGATAVTALIGFLAGQFATGACFRAVAEAYLGQKADWRSSLAFAGRKFHSILWIVVLGGVLAVVGFVFCVIPGIYLVVAFAVALPVLMSEGQRGRKALGRSRALVRGRWWKTALTLLVAGLLAAVLSSVVSGAIAAVALTSHDDPAAVFVIAAIAGTAGSLISTPFSAAYHTVLYFDLRVRKEAFDLRLLASRLGVDPAPGGLPAPPPPEPSAGTQQPPFWPPPPGWKPDEQ